MKKIIISLLCLVMLFSMAACDELEAIKQVDFPEPPAAEESPEPQASAEPEESAEPEAEAAAASEPVPQLPASEPVSNPIIIRTAENLMQELDPAEQTQVILTYSYDSPRVYIEGRDAESAKINEYLGLVDEAYFTGADYGVGSGSIGMGYDIMFEAALDNFSRYHANPSPDAVGLEYTSIRSFSTERADSNVLSLSFDSSLYMGGAHGSYSRWGIVFDTLTGERLRLDQLSTDFDAFTAFLVEKMVTMAESDSYYTERIVNVQPEAYSEAFGNILLREDSWCFTDEGILIFSNPEELGPHAAGIVEFLIPYAELEGRLDSRFMPEERGGEVVFTADAIENMKGDTEIIDKIKVDEGGAELCLTANGNAYDVSIVSVSYSDRFYETAELWYCSEMGGSAVQIQTFIPDGIPNLMLKYRDGVGQEQRLLISQSGKDGSYLLISEDIEVKG